MGKHLQTVAAMACMKSLLMIFNFIFWVSLHNCFALLREDNPIKVNSSQHLVVVLFANKANLVLLIFFVSYWCVAFKIIKSWWKKYFFSYLV